MSEAPDSGTSRRHFLKLAGIAAAGVLAITRLFRTAWGKGQPGAAPAPAPAEERPEAHRVTPKPRSQPYRARFTERARRIVFLAQKEAAWMDTDWVGPEH